MLCSMMIEAACSRRGHELLALSALSDADIVAGPHVRVDQSGAAAFNLRPQLESVASIWQMIYTWAMCALGLSRMGMGWRVASMTDYRSVWAMVGATRNWGAEE